MNMKGITTLETAVFIVMIVSAIVAMQVYIKRGIQGNIRSRIEELSGGFYEPGATFTSSTNPNNPGDTEEHTVILKHAIERRTSTLEKDVFGKTQRSDVFMNMTVEKNSNESVAAY